MSRRRHEKSSGWSAEPIYRNVALQTLFDAMMSAKSYDPVTAADIAARLARLTQKPR
ncbi:MAG: hypothetical protein GYB36_13935 [Alphaproteobacteria bacterium]|nr:hypothetical protein [Alphaproteobacteria bacterium]